MGFSRDTFYRYQAAVEADGVDALLDANRRKSNIKNRVEEATVSRVFANVATDLAKLVQDRLFRRSIALPIAALDRGLQIDSFLVFSHCGNPL